MPCPQNRMDQTRCESSDWFNALGHRRGGLQCNDRRRAGHWRRTALAASDCSAADTQGLLRAYQPARRAAVVAPAWIEELMPSTVRAPSQRRPPPAASNERRRSRPTARRRDFHMPPIIGVGGFPGYSDSFGMFGKSEDERSGRLVLSHQCCTING
ncbi:protein of unknown function [Magnetospirillum gryphiswaldense MSR-1 v2]|uniref:Uncharacterized protein n=2 Tax=Magnetospirillum gryphiswaldense TaxID=55518 RepID=V6F4Z1_MAGGM|nr:hypothetical protein mgI531 [Magnetospirillum gryphiswaldense MSR-1]CAM78057.1 hypothetical protein MGR_4125 [Magnetospirillum gryphiswaldense MSR-1]CDK99563.1 protein of unknown function [Magnetospirillum gryphiswaldense MSR-1 v2]